MLKHEQEKVNAAVVAAIDKMNEDLQKSIDAFYTSYDNPYKTRRLRSCNAAVIETENYYILRSYNTLVAAIDKTSDTLYDFLRYVYGFTSTSAQHIRKFEQDYCKGTWSCAAEYRYYDI